MQKPGSTLSGSDVAILPDGLPAMLLPWVDGHVLTREEAEERAEDLGALVVQIHRAFQGFSGVRLQYDGGLVAGMKQVFAY